MNLEASGNDNAITFDRIMVLQPKGQFNHQGTNITIEKATKVLDNIKSDIGPYLLIDDARQFQLATSEAYNLFAHYLNDLYKHGFKDCIYLTAQGSGFSKFIKRELQNAVDLKINLHFFDTISETLETAEKLGYKTSNLVKYFRNTSNPSYAY